MNIEGVSLYYEHNFPIPPEEFRSILSRCRKEWKEEGAEEFKLFYLNQQKLGNRKLEAARKERFKKFLSEFQDLIYERSDQIKIERYGENYFNR